MRTDGLTTHTQAAAEKQDTYILKCSDVPESSVIVVMVMLIHLKLILGLFERSTQLCKAENIRMEVMTHPTDAGDVVVTLRLFPGRRSNSNTSLKTLALQGQSDVSFF